MSAFFRLFVEMLRDEVGKGSLSRIAPAIQFGFMVLLNAGLCAGLYFKVIDFKDWSEFYGVNLTLTGITFAGLIGGKVGEGLAARK